MKAIKNICAIVLIIGISVLIGLFAQFMKNFFDRSAYPQKYSDIVSQYAAEYRVPEAVIYSVIKCESDFDSAAVSKSGAIGLMQIKPDTFEYLCEKKGTSYETGMLYDPKTNIEYGTYYLSILQQRFGIWETVFAAYNCGPTRVDGWIKEGKVTESGRLSEIPIGATAAYVEKVLKAIEKYENLYYSEK